MNTRKKNQWLFEAKSAHSRALQVAVSVEQLTLMTFLASSITNHYNFALTLQLIKLLLQDTTLQKNQNKSEIIFENSNKGWRAVFSGRHHYLPVQF